MQYKIIPSPTVGFCKARSAGKHLSALMDLVFGLVGVYLKSNNRSVDKTAKRQGQHSSCDISFVFHVNATAIVFFFFMCVRIIVLTTMRIIQP